MSRLLIISHDLVGPRMAGPGIRYVQLARALATEIPTILAAPQPPEPSDEQPPFADEAFNFVTYDPADWSTLLPHLLAVEICLLSGAVADRLAALPIRPPYVVIDGYDPLWAEWLALPNHTAENATDWRARHTVLQQQYLVGDFYLCASERQRDWWIGLLEAHGRINPATFRQDPSLRQLIDVVPFGLPDTVARPTRPLIKGVWPGIGANDKVLLWGGGLWPWLDPLTAIRAVAQIWQTRQDVKLIFPGTRHPNPDVVTMPTATAAAHQLASELGLLDRAVFFGDWVPYADWPNVLLESDLALSLHYDTLETRLAFRSRVLEYIWAGLSTVATRGDATSELLAHYGVGRLVDFGEVDGVAKAILTLLETPPAELAAGFAQAQRELTWQRAAQPLLAYCRQPWAAADQIGLPQSLITAALHEQHEQELAHLRAERDHWRDLAQAYERGRFIRLMKWLKERYL